MSTRIRSIVVAVIAFGLLAPRLGSAQQPVVSDMLKSFGSSSAEGTYEGTLYCIRCNVVSPSPEGRERCAKEGHVHFLLMQDGHVHPLWGVTPGIAARIDSADLHEKSVRIRGRYFAVANAILVNDVQAK